MSVASTTRVEELPQAGGAPGPATTRAAGIGSKVLDVLERYGLVVLFVLVVAYFSATTEVFATEANFRTIVGNNSVLAIAALAAIIPLVGGQFDLSVGSVLGISSIATAAALSNFELPLLVAVLVGVGLGASIGLVNGLLVAKVGVNALITTLGVATVLSGIVQWYTEGQSILRGIPGTLTDVGSGQWLGLPRPLFVLAAVALVVFYVLAYTPYGRYLHSVGSNPSSARLTGLPVDRIVLLSFVLSGTLAGLAGVLQVARAGLANPQIGPNFVLPALAAAFLGATTIRPGRYNVPGTILAVFFLAASVSGLTLSGFEPWVEPTFNGSALIIAVAMSTVIARRRAAAG